MWEKYELYLVKDCWKKKQLWSDGYFACSIGQVSQAIIEKYIRNKDKNAAYPHPLKRCGFAASNL